MRVGINAKFDAAHYLPGYEGKCVNMHGHTWHVEVEIAGPVDHSTGMVIDFVKLKEAVNETIERLDHKLLNDIIINPTCENVAAWIWDRLTTEYSIIPNWYCGVGVSVKVQEGDGGWAKEER